MPEPREIEVSTAFDEDPPVLNPNLPMLVTLPNNGADHRPSEAAPRTGCARVRGSHVPWLALHNDGRRGRMHFARCGVQWDAGSVPMRHLSGMTTVVSERHS